MTADRWEVAGRPGVAGVNAVRESWMRVVAVAPAGASPQVAVVVEMGGEKSKRRVPDPALGGLDIGRKMSSRPASVWVGELGTGRIWGTWTGVGARLEETPRRWSVLVNVPGATVELELLARDEGQVMRLGAGDGHLLVERWVGLRIGGRVRVGSEPQRVESEAGLVEHVDIDGERGARWSSACLLGRPACYVSDLGGGRENAAWTDDGIRGLAGGELALADPSHPARGPWTVATSDGRVELGFAPRLVCRGDHGATCFGTFDGRVDGIEVSRQVGICDARIARGARC